MNGQLSRLRSTRLRLKHEPFMNGCSDMRITAFTFSIEA